MPVNQDSFADPLDNTANTNACDNASLNQTLDNLTFPCLENITYEGDYSAWTGFFDYVEKFTFPTSHEWGFIGAFIVVFILTLCGNVLVIFAVVRNPQMRTVTNYYIVNLSFADILVSIICMPVTVVFETTETWYFGEIACKIIPYFQVVSMSVSVFTLSAIAIDRYFAICHPLLFKATAKRTISIILAIWIVSFIIPIPQAVVYEIEYTSPSFIFLTKCYEKGWSGTMHQKIYHCILVCIGYIIPLSMIAVAYIRVCRQLWTSLPGTLVSGNGRKKSQNRDVVNTSTENQLLSRRKVAKMLIVVVIIFTVCYLPLHLLNILRQFEWVFTNYGNTLSSRGNFHIPFLFAKWLAYANSATNPIIYNFLSAKFRREFRAAFGCCRFRKKNRRGRRNQPGYRASFFNSSTHSKTYNMYTNTEQITMSSLRRSSDKVRM